MSDKFEEEVKKVIKENDSLLKKLAFDEGYEKGYAAGLEKAAEKAGSFCFGDKDRGCMACEIENAIRAEAKQLDKPGLTG